MKRFDPDANLIPGGSVGIKFVLSDALIPSAHGEQAKDHSEEPHLSSCCRRHSMSRILLVLKRVVWADEEDFDEIDEIWEVISFNNFLGGRGK